MGTAADVDRGRGLQRGLTTKLLSMKRSSKTEIALTVANPQRYLRGRGTSVVRPWVDFTRERRWAQTSENPRREQCHVHHEFAQRTAGRVTTHEPLISALHRVRSELRVCATPVLGSVASIDQKRRSICARTRFASRPRAHNQSNRVAVIGFKSDVFICGAP